MDILLKMINSSIAAGKAILEVEGQASFSVKEKEDHSPVTEADYAANTIIENYLSVLDIPIISEETVSEGFDVRQKWDWVFIVDPLDGTKEFINGSDEFGVQMALCHLGVPKIGVIYLPKRQMLYFGSDSISAKSAQVEPSTQFESLDQIPTLELPSNTLPNQYICLASKSARSQATIDYYNELKDQYQDLIIRPMGSCTKYCAIAEGKAHQYTRFGAVMEWDTAAGDALLRSMGYELKNIFTGEPLKYNKQKMTSQDFTVKIY